MAVSRKDVQFLRSIVNRMEKDRLVTYKPSSNRNAYAMILRFKGNDGIRVSRMFNDPHNINDLKPRDILDKLDADAKDNHPSSLTMLYVRQKDTAEHRWSSNVIFPGGKRDKDEDKDDISAVRKHAYAQLGIPLKGQFVLLGRLPDIWNYSRDLEGGTLNCRFVFLHVGDMTPTLKLANHIVASTAWVPLTLLTRSHVQRDRVKHQFYSYLRSGSYRHREVRDLVSNTMMYFPSIQLPGDLGEHFGDVWGSTLSWTSTLLVYDRRRRLDWPIVSTDSFFLQHFVIYPLHGWLELRQHEVCEGEPLNALHIFCFFMVASIFCYFMGLVAYVTGTTLWVISDAMFAGGGKGASEIFMATETVAQQQKVKNFFNIPWHLMFPADLSQNKIGAPTEQENKEIIETKIMFNKLVQQVEKAPIPQGGTIIVWSDSFKSPVRERNNENNNNKSSNNSGDAKNDAENEEDKREQVVQSDDPDVLALLDIEAGYYTSLNAGDKSHQKLVEKRLQAEEKEAEEKEKRRMGKVPETPSRMVYGSGPFHQALIVGAGGYSSAKLGEQALEKRKEYQQSIKDQKDAHKIEEINEVVQNLILDQEGKAEEYFTKSGSASTPNQSNRGAGENHAYDYDAGGRLMTKEEIAKELAERESERYLQKAKDDTDEERRIESEVASMEKM